MEEKSVTIIPIDEFMDCSIDGLKKIEYIAHNQEPITRRYGDYGEICGTRNRPGWENDVDNKLIEIIHKLNILIEIKNNEVNR